MAWQYPKFGRRKACLSSVPLVIAVNTFLTVFDSEWFPRMLGACWEVSRRPLLLVRFCRRMNQIGRQLGTCALTSMNQGSYGWQSWRPSGRQLLLLPERTRPLFVGAAFDGV